VLREAISKPYDEVRPQPGGSDSTDTACDTTWIPAFATMRIDSTAEASRVIGVDCCSSAGSAAHCSAAHHSYACRQTHSTSNGTNRHMEHNGLNLHIFICSGEEPSAHVHHLPADASGCKPGPGIQESGQHVSQTSHEPYARPCTVARGIRHVSSTER